jgi:hypothetical protein
MTKIWMSTLSDIEYTEAQILNLDEFIKLGIKLMSGEPLSDRFPRTTVEIQSDHPPADYFNTGGMFVVSDRLKAVLEECDAKAEYFELEILFQGKPYTERRYYFANILDKVDCFDREKGKYQLDDAEGFKDYICKIYELRIDENRASGHALFRLAKCWDDIICVSDRLAYKITAMRLTGMNFVPPAEWKGCSK